MIEPSRAMKEHVKRDRASADKPLAGKTLAMIFDKPSTRTRVSFDVAMRQLGGDVVMLTGQEMQLGRGETIADTARVLSRYVDAIMIRILNHEALIELARHATVPVINGLTRLSHPVPGDGRRDDLRGAQGPHQRPHGRVDRRRQQCAVLLDACGQELRLPSQGRDAAGTQGRPKMAAWARESGAKIDIGHDPEEAVPGADCVVTDTWVSMGDRDGERRHNLLRALSGQRPADGAGEARRDLHALPARPTAATRSPTR